MKAFPESQQLVQGTVTVALRASRAPIPFPPPPPEQGVTVLHRGPGGIIPIPLKGDPAMYKGIDDDPEFADWEGRQLPPFTLKLQLIAAKVRSKLTPPVLQFSTHPHPPL